MDPNINLWANVWKWILLGGSVAFLALLTYVTLWGALDIKNLFETLSKRKDEETQSRD